MDWYKKITPTESDNKLPIRPIHFDDLDILVFSFDFKGLPILCMDLVVQVLLYIQVFPWVACALPVLPNESVRRLPKYVFCIQFLIQM